MRRLFALATAGLFLALGPNGAADPPPPPAGAWKLTFPVERGQDVTFLLSFDRADGKWTGQFLAAALPLRMEPKLDRLAVDGAHLAFAVKFGDRDFVSFDGLVDKDGKKVRGSYSVFGAPAAAGEMRASQLKKLDDPFDLARENLAQMEDGPALFDAAFEVLGQAALKKVKPEEVRGLVERVTKAAAAYGPRWDRAVTVRLAHALLGQEGTGDVALGLARRAERMLGDDDEAGAAMETLELVAKGLSLAGKADEAKPYLVRIGKLEARDYSEYAKKFPPFKPEEYKGRKGTSDRTVLVESFSGAECPPCVAVDLAWDGLLRTYKPGEAVFLQYHLHVPGPDPMTGPETVDRVRFYAEKVRGLPAVFVDGKAGPEGGGPAAASDGKYKEYRKLIEDDLERPAPVKLALTATRQDKGYALKAAVSGLAAPGEKVVLRFALAEERVRYAGGNGLRYHHMVVRDMPGGAKGTPLTKATHEQTVAVDPDALREKLAKYLTDFAKSDSEFPSADRPLSLKNLKAVAFVQNDATGEVLQAAQVDLDGK